LIPDDAAYRQVLIVIAAMAARPDRQKALDAYFGYMEAVATIRASGLASARLSTRDRNALRAIAVDLDQRSRSAGRNLGKQRAAFTASARQRIQSDLAPDGAAILQAFVMHGVKERMKVIQ
jgi:hypothetical protein